MPQETECFVGIAPRLVYLPTAVQTHALEVDKQPTRGDGEGDIVEVFDILGGADHPQIGGDGGNNPLEVAVTLRSFA